MTDSKQFRLTIHHDDDASDLNPNEQDSPLFKLHSFNRDHINYTDPDVFLACEYVFPENHSDDGYECSEMPTDHGEGKARDDHDWVGPGGYLLSYFEHGQCRWGLAGTMTNMPDFRWDGVQYAGFLEVVVPDDEREWWDGRPTEDRTAAAESFLSEYTDWCNGEVYGYTLERLNPRTCNLGYVHEENEDLDSCWGFIGFDWIQEEVRGVTHSMGATEENTEIVDEAYGAADYGRWFVNEEEAREIDKRLAKLGTREGMPR